jgi:uncharacterized protein YhaN
MAAEAALKLVETEEVESKALSLVEQAGMVKIEDAKGYEVAGFLWKTIGEVMKEVSETFDPLIEAAHRNHKLALEKKAKFYAPLDKAKRDVKQLMSAWDAEQERLRLAEQKRLEEEARKAEEERRLQEAIEAEEEAKANGLTAQEAAQEAEAVLQEPIYVAPVVIQKTTPKVQGVVFREIWKAQVVDLRALVNAVAAGKAPIQALKADEVFLGQQARSLKSALNLPGVKSFSERV